MYVNSTKYPKGFKAVIFTSFYFLSTRYIDIENEKTEDIGYELTYIIETI